MHPACSRHSQVQQVHLHQGPQDNDPDVFLEDNTTVLQTHEEAGIICVSTEWTCSPHGDFVLIVIIFKTQNQEQDDDSQPENRWINSQVTERQHPHWCKNDRKSDKTVGVKVNDVSETTTSIEETKLSDNNAAVAAEFVDHPNDVENIDFEAEFENLMIADIEDADTMLGQHEKVPEQCFFLMMHNLMDCLYLCLHSHHLRMLPHQ